MFNILFIMYLRIKISYSFVEISSNLKYVEQIQSNTCFLSSLSVISLDITGYDFCISFVLQFLNKESPFRIFLKNLT